MARRWLLPCCWGYDADADADCSVRRNSVYTGGPRASMAPGGFAPSAPRDTRPYRDKGFQAECQGNVSDYLMSHRLPMTVTGKTLSSPTAKEFQTMFRFIINDMIDPSLQWTKKFEDDCLMILKDLKYPAMETMGKTALGAPGTPQHWPMFLAMLSWLVELCKVREEAVLPSQGGKNLPSGQWSSSDADFSPLKGGTTRTRRVS